MSRSGKKTPIAGVTTACSEKKDKQGSARRNRRTNKVILHKAKLSNPEELDSLVMELPRETVSIWSFNKDGKRYYFFEEIEDRERAMRK